MSCRTAGARAGGFSLVEAIAAIALMAIIVMALSAVAGQWLPNWSRGFAGLQRADLLAVALERLSDDLSAAEYVTPSSEARGPLFEGDASSVTCVRAAIGPDAFPHLEVVRFAKMGGERGYSLSRMRALFTPAAQRGGSAALTFGDESPLVRAPLEVSFAYAGPDRVWVESWRGQTSLPDAVRITVRDAGAGGALIVSTAVRVRVTARAMPEVAAQAASGSAQPLASQPPAGAGAPPGQP